MSLLTTSFLYVLEVPDSGIGKKRKGMKRKEKKRKEKVYRLGMKT